MKDALKQKKVAASRMAEESEVVKEEIKKRHQKFVSLPSFLFPLARRRLNASTTRQTTLGNTYRSIQMDLTRLRGRIIQSPERIKSNLSEMTLAIGRERETILSLEKKEREMNAKVGSLVKYQVVSYLSSFSLPSSLSSSPGSPLVSALLLSAKG